MSLLSTTNMQTPAAFGRRVLTVYKLLVPHFPDCIANLIAEGFTVPAEEFDAVILQYTNTVYLIRSFLRTWDDYVFAYHHYNIRHGNVYIGFQLRIQRYIHHLKCQKQELTEYWFSLRSKDLTYPEMQNIQDMLKTLHEYTVKDNDELVDNEDFFACMQVSNYTYIESLENS